MLDLRDAATRTALGVRLEDLTGERAMAQAVAPRAQASGAHGMIVPSAARPDAWNLVIFPAGFPKVTVGRGRAVRPRPPADTIILRAAGG